MRKLIELTQLNYQKVIYFGPFELYRKPSTFGKVTVDANKIVTFGTVKPIKSSVSYRSDYQTYTLIELVGAKNIHVLETPSEVRDLLEK